MCCIWVIFELYLSCILVVTCIWVVFELFVLYLSCIWVVFELYLSCIWVVCVVFGLYLGCIWVVFELYLSCIWVVFDCIWVVFESYIIPSGPENIWLLSLVDWRELIKHSITQTVNVLKSVMLILRLSVYHDLTQKVIDPEPFINDKYVSLRKNIKFNYRPFTLWVFLRKRIWPFSQGILINSH